MKLTNAKIADLGKIVTGKTPSTKNKENFNGDIPFITPVDMTYNRNVFFTERHISSRGAESVKGCILPPKTVCVSCIGSDMGKAVITTETSVTNQQINSIIVGPEHNYQYVYYLMRTLESTIKSLGKNGTAVPILSKSKFSDIEICVHDFNSQCRIAKILSTYDDLIENNQKQIKLLEEAAQRLYKEWFVDLRFPGYESTHVIDGVPQGWRKELVGNVIEKSYRSKQVKTGDYLEEGKIPVIDQSRDFVAGYTNDEETLVSLGMPVIVFGDHTRILKYIQFPFAKGADGTQLIISKCENMPQPLLYLSLSEIDLSNYHYARHFKYLKAEEITVPDMITAKSFEKLVQPLFTKVQILRNQINNAKEARDRLLPKLMSGELEV